MALRNPPPPLQQAINSSAKRYAGAASMPVSAFAQVLTGIWRIESGSSYPNQFVNSIGYGGLFGTTDWNGTPQSQANLAASILSRLVVENHGNLGQALYHYSGGGYTSVPGGPGVSYGKYTNAPPVSKSSQVPSASQSGERATSQPQSAVPTSPAFDATFTTQDPYATQPLEPPPGSGMGSASTFVSGLWSRIASQPGASADTQLLAQNAQLLGG